MNFSIIRNIVGKIMVLLAILLILPMIVAIIYNEGWNIIGYAIPMVLLLAVGLILCLNKIQDKKMGAKEGFVIVSLSWVLMSLFGCIPFIVIGILNGEQGIPNFFNAFFEMASGFTTTGSSVVVDVEKLAKSVQFWRSFSHWIGGMGILVFILALIPESNEGSSMHILRAESPGPQVGKLVSKMKVTSRILYLIYFFMTLILIGLLYGGHLLGWDDKMTLFNSIIYSLGTAGTGGFSVDATGLAEYSAYSQYVVSIGMILFAINFTMYYLMLFLNFKEIFKNEELKAFLIIVAAATVIITLNIFLGFDFKNAQGETVHFTFEESFRHSLFQVASIISTTGYSSTNCNIWPPLAKTILIFLMAFGGCAGSTAGGLKVSRVVILFKAVFTKIKNMISPRKVETIKVNSRPLDEGTINGVQSFLIIYCIVFVACALLISIDGFSLETNFTASLTCISNVGPAFGEAYANFSGFSWFSKLLLAFEMIAGRLEIFPLLILFYPKTWMKR